MRLVITIKVNEYARNTAKNMIEKIVKAEKARRSIPYPDVLVRLEKHIADSLQYIIANGEIEKVEVLE